MIIFGYIFVGVVCSIFSAMAMHYAISKIPASGDLLVTKDNDGYYLTIQLEKPIPDDVLLQKTVIFKVKDLTRL